MTLVVPAVAVAPSPGAEPAQVGRPAHAVGPAARWDEWAHGGCQLRAPAAFANAPEHNLHLQRLAAQRIKLLSPLGLADGQTVAEVGSSDGLLAYGAGDLLSETRTAFSLVLDADARALSRAACAGGDHELPPSPAVRFLRADPAHLPLPTASVDVLVLREQLAHRSATTAGHLLGECARLLRPGGRFALLETLHRRVRWRAAPGTPPMPEAVRRLHRQLLAWPRRSTPAAPIAPRAGSADAAYEPWRPTTANLLSALAQSGLVCDHVCRGEQVLSAAATASEVMDWCWTYRADNAYCPLPPPGAPLFGRLPADSLAHYLSYWFGAAQYGPVRRVVPLLYVWGTRPTETR